ncbi:P-loop containing nucleoside triphosphate hydrolase protein [Syncephalastrum racemosum]|uniref:P-loop containing nucleoside triphosphate hydrolase protein n=1 Tax=Syncephalastrum racemosum TaxID=13706 RepID=A0A1X2HGD5_SYNRA|nr:P-loop containing nucleoside triphosphate hydrolase protein [Syncephalastrum racemosum]
MPKTSSTQPRKRARQQDPIPDFLIELTTLFERANTFCAFCDARLTTALTLDKILSSVNDLQLRDLAGINAILPNFIHYYKEDTVVVVQFGKPLSKQTMREKHSAAMASRGDDWQFKQPRPVKPEAIQKTIQSRNKQFQKAVTTFTNRCRKEGVDPEARYAAAVEDNLRQIPTVAQEPETDNTTASTTVTAVPDHSSIPEVIHGLSFQAFYDHQLDDRSCWREIPAREANYGELDPPLLPEMKEALRQRGIDSLFAHQADAIRALREHHHVIVTTATASGKSLIYQIPVLEKLMTDPASRAIYIFPTKALAQDQMRALQELMRSCPSLNDTQISTFDGDTPSDQRAAIRANASVIFTNPDMLHHAILPNANAWRSFLSSVTYVVVDELHVYNGLFGSNVALIMRRLRRLCHHFGNHSMQFVSCSATIRDPKKHMQLMFGVNDVAVVQRDGAPSGKKNFILWNPPLTHPSDPHSPRRNAISEAADIIEYLLIHNVRTIAFCKIRKTCELLMKHLRENLEKNQRRHLMDRVQSYRGGYMPQDRRQIEKKMFRGELLGVVATNALELGVDIGSLDAVIMVGMPWSISAMWQQSGRAGRRNADSLSMVIADGNPLDQYYSRHPSVLFEREPDDISFDVENGMVLESHLQCAAEELPVDTDRDRVYFGNQTQAICEAHLTPIDTLRGLYRPHMRFRPHPAQFVNVRNIVQDTYLVIDTTGNRNSVLEEIEASRASFEIYEGAIFIHQGRTYLVDECNTDQRYACVHLVRVDWTTQQRDYTNVNVINTSMSKPIHGTTHSVGYGRVQIETVVFGYYKMDKRNRIMDTVELYMDPILRESTGVWVDLPSRTLADLDAQEIDRMAAVHACAHIMISLLPRFTTSTQSDVRTECKSPHATRPRPPRIALYETQPSGIARKAYGFFDQLVQSCVEQIEKCTCEEGCPSCVHLTSCSEHNAMCSKAGASLVLRQLLSS